MTRRDALWALGASGLYLATPKIAQAATFALVDHVGTVIGSGGTTNTINSSGADFLIAVVAADNGSAPGIAADSKGNANWHPCTAATQGGGSMIQVFYTQGAVTVGASHTITVSGPGSLFGWVCFAAFSGANQSSPLDQQSGGTSSGPPTTSGSITPTASNCLIISGNSSFSGAPTSSTGGLAMLDNSISNSGVNYGGGAAYVIQTTATAINPSWAGGYTSGLGSATVASFKSTSSGGSPVVQRRH